MTTDATVTTDDTGAYEDIGYEEKDHVATITFNRPEKLNAFRGNTYAEVTDAVLTAG